MKIYAERNLMFSNYLRVQLVCNHLAKEEDIEIEYFYFTDEMSGFQPGKAFQADVILFQNPRLMLKAPSGLNYIWDLDDVMDAEEATDDPRILRASMDIAFSKTRKVIWGNEAIKKHYGDRFKGESMVMDDFLDPCTHKAVNKKSKRIKIGYIGTNYYVEEVRQLIPIMKSLMEKYDVDCGILGVDDLKEDIIEAGIEFIPYNNNYDNFNQYLADQGFTIGIVWYDQSKEINIPKTHLKFSEFSWLGIPTVSSRFITGDYVGEQTILCGNLQELEIGLMGMIESKKMRGWFSVEAELFAKDNFSLHKRLPIYINFFKEKDVL